MEAATCHCAGQQTGGNRPEPTLQSPGQRVRSRQGGTGIGNITKTAMHRAQACAVALALSLLLSPAAAASGERWTERDIERCRADARFKVGGAAIGDCLLELSADVDRQIALELQRSDDRYCRSEDRAALQQSHRDWESYRRGFCGLVENSPDNTPSYVNSASCQLELGRHRLSDLRYTTRYGLPRCP